MDLKFKPKTKAAPRLDQGSLAKTYVADILIDYEEDLGVFHFFDDNGSRMETYTESQMQDEYPAIYNAFKKKKRPSSSAPKKKKKAKKKAAKKVAKKTATPKIKLPPATVHLISRLSEAKAGQIFRTGQFDAGKLAALKKRGYIRSAGHGVFTVTARGKQYGGRYAKARKATRAAEPKPPQSKLGNLLRYFTS